MNIFFLPRAVGQSIAAVSGCGTMLPRGMAGACPVIGIAGFARA